MAAPVFIWYASPDFDSALTLRDDLEADGLGCWMAPRDVPAGADFAVAIPEAIGQAAMVVLLLSEGANASDNVRREAHLAVQHKLPILPVRLEEVAPEGALAFLLADAQRIDAFPRIEPSLAQIRRETRRLLQQAGHRQAPAKRRTRFQSALASAAAWATVAVLMVVQLVWMQRTWFNLVPLVGIWRVVMRLPVVLTVVAVVPAAAVAVQFWVHRNARRALSLDALFGVGERGARARLAGAVALLFLLLAAIRLAPATVSIHLEESPIDRYNRLFTRAMVGPTRNYLTQCHSHYVVTTRVGRMNPPGEYIIRIELAPYATRDGVEFGDLLIDQRLGVTQVDPVADDRRTSGFVELRAPLTAVVGERVVRVQATHYRDAIPGAARIAASISLTDQSRADATPHPISASVFCTN